MTFNRLTSWLRLVSSTWPPSIRGHTDQSDTGASTLSLIADEQIIVGLLQVLDHRLSFGC